MDLHTSKLSCRRHGLAVPSSVQKFINFKSQHRTSDTCNEAGYTGVRWKLSHYLLVMVLVGLFLTKPESWGAAEKLLKSAKNKKRPKSKNLPRTLELTKMPSRLRSFCAQICLVKFHYCYSSFGERSTVSIMMNLKNCLSIFDRVHLFLPCHQRELASSTPSIFRSSSFAHMLLTSTCRLYTSAGV